MPRFYCPLPLSVGDELALPPNAARHVQVLRLQPGQALTLFNGLGGEFSAQILQMGRSDVSARIDSHHSVEREAGRDVHLTVGMPANDRMDWLVEKATELGVASIQPLHMAHSVLRLKGERAEKKQAHWQAIAVAACEQCGRNRVPVVHPVREFQDWVQGHPRASGSCIVLSLQAGAIPLRSFPGLQTPQPMWLLNGPEGGLSASEEALARQLGWQAAALGSRILRAETAALAGLALAVP